MSSKKLIAGSRRNFQLNPPLPPPSLSLSPSFCVCFYDSRKHDWFQKELPAYLFPSPVDQDTSVIDTDAVSEVCEVIAFILIEPSRWGLNCFLAWSIV